MKKGLICMLALITLLSVLLGCGEATPATTPAAEVITLTAMTAWAKDYEDNDKLFEWIDLVHEKGGGRIKIEYKGGPESIPQREQVPALQKGVIDIVGTPGAYYNNIVPAALCLNASRLRPEQEREAGFYDLMQKVYAEHGLTYLARTAGSCPVAYYWTSFPVTSLADFKGKKMRSTSSTVGIIEALGAAPVALTMGELYDAMEKRLIDGFNSPIIASTPRGFHDVTSYIVDTPLDQLPIVSLMNLDSLNSLPKDIQQMMKDTALEVEKTVGPYFLTLEAKEVQILKDSGMIFVSLPADEAQWLLDKYDEVYWQQIIEGDPENGPTLKKMCYDGITFDRGPEFWKNQ